jgi:hypothetical protein
MTQIFVPGKILSFGNKTQHDYFTLKKTAHIFFLGREALRQACSCGAQ